jgi:transcriptional regulator with XRE-family HTH domain
MSIDLNLLRETRLRRGMTLKQAAARVGVSTAQIQRLEKGERRMTVDMLEAYCAALRISPIELFGGAIRVPVIGVLDHNSGILPLPAGSPNMTRAPYIVAEPQRLAAVRWHAQGRHSLMGGWQLFFYADVEGIAPAAWNRRCIMRRRDGTQRIGWLMRQEGQVHINDVSADVEFNVAIEWASPILAVIAPQVLADVPDRNWV